MTSVILAALGMIFGSFVNALVWRIHEQTGLSGKKKVNKQYAVSLSISRGRSMCSVCHHLLAVWDLIPVFSWLSLGGRCRYCRQPIQDSPLVEVGLAAVFVASYLWWPMPLVGGREMVVFGLWLVLCVGFMALAVYDLRWMLLPNRLIYPLSVVALALALIRITLAEWPLGAGLQTLLAVAVGGGIFYLLFQLSSGKWIGGGDVRLGWLLGLTLSSPARSLLVIFLAALSGSLVSLPLLFKGRLKPHAIIPFGPFLILAAVLVQLFGADILNWYQHSLLLRNS